MAPVRSTKSRNGNLGCFGPRCGVFVRAKSHQPHESRWLCRLHLRPGDRLHEPQGRDQATVGQDVERPPLVVVEARAGGGPSSTVTTQSWHASPRTTQVSQSILVVMPVTLAAATDISPRTRYVGVSGAQEVRASSSTRASAATLLAPAAVASRATSLSLLTTITTLPWGSPATSPR